VMVGFLASSSRIEWRIRSSNGGRMRMSVFYTISEVC
jgi:hypothetical protein